MSLAAGAVALAAIGIIIAGALLALAITAIYQPAQLPQRVDPYLLHVTGFTLWQAFLSTLLSLAGAIALTMALARRQDFPGRRLLLNFFAVPLALPALVAVLGIVEVWGRTGWINELAAAFGFSSTVNIYGLTGILLAHVFFNLPLATRLLLVHFERVPAETWRLASQLGMPSSAIWRLIEWPIIRSALPGIATLVFMLCVASFTIVLTLGGGPRATTIEVAIYQALRFDFDPVRAVILALVQLVLCAGLVGLAGSMSSDMLASPGYGRPVHRPDLSAPAGRILDGTVILLASLFVVVPLIAVVVEGMLSPLPRLIGEFAVWRAIATSTVVAAISAVLAGAAAWFLIQAARATRAGVLAPMLFKTAVGVSGNLILVVPPIVLGAGWFIMLRGHADVFALAPVMVIAINTLMALPFVLRILAPAMHQAGNDHDRLCASLGISGWARFRLIDVPVLARPFCLALAFAAALSIGDLGVIALFGSEDFITLPFLLYQRFGSYRIDDAAGLALILMVFCLGLIVLAERIAAPRQRGNVR